MYNCRKIKYFIFTFVLFYSLLFCTAVAEKPIYTITYAKDSYMPGEMIEAHYKINFDGGLSVLFVEWCIITNWETEDIQSSDSFCEMTTLEGDLSFSPVYGEGAVPYFTLVDTDGRVHSFWGDPVRITEAPASEPKYTLTFDKDLYAAGETIKVNYKIDFDSEYTSLYAEWNIITDWESGVIESGDSFSELTALEGDLSYTPAYGEGAILHFTLIQANGKQHSFWSDPVRITENSVSEPKCTLTFDKDIYAAGEAINVHYKIDFNREYTMLYAEWNVITDWEHGVIESGDSFYELTALEGDLSYIPAYGEGAILYFTLVEASGKQHSFWGDPVKIIGNSISEPECTLTFDKDIYAAGETINVHYKISFDGDYTALYAEWNVIANWETGEINPENSFHELTLLEGDLSFKPVHGEGVILDFTLVDNRGNSYSFLSDPVQIVQTTISEPQFTVIFDKNTYELGEMVNAYYKIDFDDEYTALYAEWNVVTDWKTGEIQSGNIFQELTALEGNLSFTINSGEGIALYFTLVGGNNKVYSYFGEPVRIGTISITYLPKALTKIEREAFKGSSFTQIVCPDNLLSIGSRAFSDCTNLLNITIPASVKDIAEDAFEGCTSLTMIITEKGSVAEAYALRHGYTVRYR